MVDACDARGAALQILRKVRHGATFGGARDAELSGLGDAERRLAHEIAAGVLRNRTRLDSQLKPLVTAPWERLPADVKDILRIGTYQIDTLDRVPGHAAVNTSVELAKKTVGAKSSSLVNAVLRRLHRNFQQRKELATPPDSLADQFSHPQWLTDRWERTFGRDKTRELLEHNNRKPQLVLQPAKLSAQELRDLLEQHSVTYHTASGGPGIIPKETRVGDLPGFADGAFVVQDPTQALIIEFAEVSPGDVVWDACAAPGGKTVGLARLGARVIATDASQPRFKQLRETIYRTSADVELMIADAEAHPFREQSVDVLFLDVPCSGTGVMARHPDARWQLNPKRIEALIRQQERLLQATWPVVRPGGCIVYSTCSIEDEENTAQIDNFLRSHAQFARVKSDLFRFPGPNGDGGYAAKIVRS